MYVKIKRAVVQGILELDLAGLSKGGVKTYKNARNIAGSGVARPCIAVANSGNKAPKPTGGTNLRDDIPYPVLIAALQDNGTLDQEEFEDRITNWIERIGSKFRHQPLTAYGLPNVWFCEVVSDTSFDPGFFGKGVDASAIVLRFISREARG